MYNSLRLDRRRLLQGGASLGIGSIVPSMLLAGCGGGGASDDGVSPSLSASASAPTRETRTLQFDLSAGAIATPRFELPGSRHDRASLVVHTAASRAACRAADPALAAVPDARLTHYLDEVDLPAAALQVGRVTGRHPVTGSFVLATAFLHVPGESARKVAAARLRKPLVDRQPPGSLRSPQALVAVDGLPPIISLYSAPRAIATALVFQHPAIANLDADLGADIVDRISTLPDASTPYLNTLMAKIGQLLLIAWPTTSEGSWATLILRTDPATGAPVLDDNGDPVYSYRINPALLAPVADVVKRILNNLNDDAAFENTNWQPSVGAPASTPMVAANASGAGFAASRAVGAQSSQFGVVHSLKVGSRTSGIRLQEISCTDDRAVSLKVSNEFLRSAGVFVQFLRRRRPRRFRSTVRRKSTRPARSTSRWSRPTSSLMGVPLARQLGSGDPDQFHDCPTRAAQAILYYGGLGLGGGRVSQRVVARLDHDAGDQHRPAVDLPRYRHQRKRSQEG